MREILREGDISIWGSTALEGARGVMAIASFNQGRQIITAEKYGQSFSALAIYDARSLEKQKVLVLPETTPIPHILRVVSDPETVLINYGHSLRMIHLNSRTVEDHTFGMDYYIEQVKWWQIPFKEKDWLTPGNIEIFDEGKIMVAYCGRSSHFLPDYLLSWELSSDRLIKGPVYTLQNYSYYCFYAKIGAVDHERRQYITTDRLGTVKFWNIDDLSLDRQWQVPSAEDKHSPEAASGRNSLNIVTFCSDKQQLAVGTWYGPIHIVDIQSGKKTVDPLIAQESEFKEEENYSSYRHLNGMPKEIISLAFFAKGNRLIAAHRDGSIRIWNTESGEQVGATSYCIGKSCASSIWINSHINKAIFTLDNSYGSSTDVLLFNLSPYI